LHPHGQQHPVGLSAEAVVLAVGVVEAIEQRPAPEQRAEAAVDVEVVHQRVGGAVGGDADPDRHEVAEPGPVEADEQRDPDERGERHREHVVALEALVGRAVVAAVEPQSRAVHDPAVGGVGDRLHQHEGHHGQSPTDHHRGLYGGREPSV
jgi:hypothetical protein